MIYSPDRKLLVTDSYPDKNSIQHQRVSVLEKDCCVEIGGYHSMLGVSDWRCDLHPRWSPDGRLITFDSSHEGHRGIYAVNADEIREYLASEGLC